jgi:hypothetical protein
MPLDAIGGHGTDWQAVRQALGIARTRDDELMEAIRGELQDKAEPGTHPSAPPQAGGQALVNEGRSSLARMGIPVSTAGVVRSAHAPHLAARRLQGRTRAVANF